MEKIPWFMLAKQVIQMCHLKQCFLYKLELMLSLKNDMIVIKLY